MSPLLGSIGGASEYAYRGNLDDWPDEFNFISLTDQEPGGIYTSGITTITGINYKALVTISGVGSFSVNGGALSTSPKYIRNNEIISIQVPTTSGTFNDFNKNYSSTITVGKRSSTWNVRTRDLDAIPTGFDFTDLTDQSVSIAVTSNTVTVVGLETGVIFPIQVSSGIGSIRINGASPVYSGNVTNGDTVSVATSSPSTYSTTNTSIVLVGTYSTDFNVTTRAVDLTPDQFVFTNQTNVGFGSTVFSNTITLVGIDTGQFATASISPSTFEFNVTDAFDNVLYPYTSFDKDVTNGNKITLRTIASTAGSTTTSGTLTITGISSTFSVTTRPPIYRTYPNQFTFTDLTELDTDTLTESNDVTLVGITTGFFGTASITNGEYRVTRSGSVVQDYTTGTFLVTVGDVIRLRKTTPSAVEQTTTVIFQVSGVDTTTNIDGDPGSTSDSWALTTRLKDCIANSKSLSNVSGVEPGTTHSTSFTADGFDTGCNMKVSTSNSNSYLVVGGVTGTSNVTVTPGQTVTVYLTASSSYSDTRTTTITLKSDDRDESTTFDWSVSTRAIDCTPTGTPKTLGPGAQCSSLVTDVNQTSYEYLSVAPSNTPAGVSEHLIQFNIDNFDSACGDFSVGGTGVNVSISPLTLNSGQKSLIVTLSTPSGFRDEGNYSGDSFFDLSLIRGSTRVFGPVRFRCRTCSRAQYTARVNAGCYSPL